MKTLLSLDLGSGTEPAPGYAGVDVFEQDEPRVIYADLFSGEPWPFEDASCDRLRASHVIEHIPHTRVPFGTTRVKRVIRTPGKEPATEWKTITTTQDAFFWFFDEAFRVAAPGCRFTLAWPHPLHDWADQDPTHCRRIPSATLNYLSREGRRALRVCQYPVGCDWRVESLIELATDTALRPFENDIAEARRHHGVFHEITAVLVKD